MIYFERKFKITLTKLHLIGYILIAFDSFCLAADSVAVIPTPQFIELKNKEIILSDNWSVVLDKMNEQDFFTAEYLTQKINNRHGIFLNLEDIKATRKNSNNYIILGKIDTQKTKEFITEEDKAYFVNMGEEGYFLDISSNRISILGNTSKGTFYGIQTLLQLIKEKDSKIVIPAVKIIDYPKVKMRAVHFSGVNPEKIKGQLDRISQLKYNTAIIETQSYFYLNRSEERSRMEEIFRYARKRFIEPIPELQSFGASGPVVTKDPFAVEGIRIEDEPFRFIGNLAKPIIPTDHSLVNVIIDGEDKVIVKSKNRSRVYIEGKDYKIIKGPISYPFRLNNTPTQIMKTADSDIKENEEVFISYTYFENKASYKCPDSTILYCPSTERTYKIMFDAIENVIEILHPDYLSIGHDEIRGINRDNRCRKRNLSNAEILAEDINKLYDFSKSINPDIKILMWSDMLNPYDNGGNANFQLVYDGLPGETAPASDLISKDMIIMLWRYDPDRNFLVKSSDYFESKQFKYLVAGWNNKQNIFEWAKIAKERTDCLGIIVTTWHNWEGNIEAIKYTAEVSWH